MVASGATRSVATVFGGSGFIGRYVVKRLAAQGYVVRVAVRDPESGAVPQADGRRGPGGAALCLGRRTRRPWPARWRVPRSWSAWPASWPSGGGAISSGCRTRAPRTSPATPPPPGSRGWSMSRRSAPIRPARAATRPARARASRRSGRRIPTAAILRPSVVFGPEDAFFNRFAGMAQLLPFMPVISGETRFQPVYVGDVADAVMASLARPDAAGAIFELGGPRVWSFRELLAYILTETHRRRRMVTIPMGLARIQASRLGAAARTDADARPAAAACPRQRRLPRTARTGRAGHRADPDRAGRAAIPAPLPSWRRQARGAAGGAKRDHIGPFPVGAEPPIPREARAMAPE